MISVIVPVYNATPFLEIAVNSILIHHQVGEVLLIEDGSSDGSMDLCYNLKERDSRIRILIHENGSNRGAAESRNLGIKNVRFPFVAFLDSDDKFFGIRFDLALHLLSQNPELDGCYGKALVNYVDKNYHKIMGPPIDLPSNKLFSFILNGGYFHTNTLTVRKSFLLKLEGFNQTCWPHEDVELWTRLAYYGRIESIPDDQPIAEYKIHGKNLSQIGNWKTKRALWKTVFTNFFFKSISFKDRYFILKQLSKVTLEGLKINWH